MIRPGKMRHKITLQRVGRAPNDQGTEVETWLDLATLRAELVELVPVEDAKATAGTRGRVRVTFRTWLFGGVTVGDRIQWRGQPYDIRAIPGGDFAEGRTLELVCEGAA